MLKLPSYVFAAALLCGLPAVAQTAPPPAFVPPPIPRPLQTAKKVFISNAGADSGLFPHPFTGTPDRGYGEFYNMVAGLGRFQLVDDPAAADLVLELQLQAPSGPQSPNKQNGASDPLPMFRLVIVDAKTHYTLWAFTESIDPAARQKTHDDNFDDALTNIVNDLKRITLVPVP